jgi:DNA-binding MarR family transcriptional regulator
MKPFNMYEANVKPAESSEIHSAVHELGRDEAGRLYSVRMRELMKPLGVDIAAVEALAALRIAGKTMRMAQERWAEKHGLSEGRLGVMFRLFRGGDCQLGDLAEDLESTPRNITGLVDHLERDGLVERIPDTQDRRSVRARLTPAGRERIESIWREGLEHQYEVVQGMSKDDLAQLRHLCLQLVENARKEWGK